MVIICKDEKCLKVSVRVIQNKEDDGKRFKPQTQEGEVWQGTVYKNPQKGIRLISMPAPGQQNFI